MSNLAKLLTVASLSLLLSVFSTGDAHERTATPRTRDSTQDELESARKATDIFLKGLKLSNLSEGREMLRSVQWITGEADHGQNFYAHPRFTDFSTLFEKLFNSDIHGVQGYKRLLEMKAVSEAGTPLTIQYIMIAFRDRRTNVWKVLGTGTEDSVDIDRQVAFSAKQLSSTDLPEQENLLTYGNWLLRAGRISESRAALAKALNARADTNDSPGAARLRQIQIQALLTVIERITSS
jgi:hypothetical protein